MNYTEDEIITAAANGNDHAALFMREVFEASQILDDLYDKDKDVSKDTVERMGWLLSVSIPSNAFYRDHFSQLQSFIRQAHIDWMVANRIEANGGNMTSYIIRDQISMLTAVVAEITGGLSAAINISMAARSHVHDEDLEAYLEVLRNG